MIILRDAMGLILLLDIERGLFVRVPVGYHIGPAFNDEPIDDALRAAA
jgi:hypothetical protein